MGHRPSSFLPWLRANPVGDDIGWNLASSVIVFFYISKNKLLEVDTK